LKNVDNKSRNEVLEGMASPPSCEAIGRAARNTSTQRMCQPQF
jgi:hypothetical protein